MAKRPAADSRIDRVLKEIDRRLGDPGLTASGLAAAIGLDLSGFCRAFRGSMGTTCTAYIAQRRIEHAKHLLDQNELLIKEVAGLVGYSDANYFARRFRNIVGCSPSAYRISKPHNPSR
jgi:AraC-like DNA-binding protein